MTPLQTKLNSFFQPEPKPAAQDDLIESTYGMTAEFEGFRAKPYRDTKGKLTVGIGTNLDNPGVSKLFEQAGVDEQQARKSGVDRKQAEALLKAGLQIAQADAKRLVPNFDQLPLDARRVVLDMSYNLGGPKLSEFKNMISALQRNDFNAAADEMVDSRWFGQTGNRSRALVSMMRSLAQKQRSGG